MGSLPKPLRPFAIKRIAIIGTGPSGLACAKYLLSTTCFPTIDIYEQQSQVGGVWNYTPLPSETVSIPSTTPFLPPDTPAWPPSSKAPIFSNPMYEKLNTNIPKPLMQFSDQAFLPESLLYASREDVQEYLITYAAEIRHLIKFCTQVTSLTLSHPLNQDLWTLTSKSTVTSVSITQEYDAVVIATGHYSVPFIPSVPGISAFAAAHPGVITHSRIYRSPEPFRGQKVIVVGNAASGLDIGLQIADICAPPLLNSIRNPPVITHLSLSSTRKEVPPIASFLPSSRSVRFTSGLIECDIDAVVYCTGYLYSFPFLSSLALDPTLITDGRRVRGLYKHLFHATHPTLAFPALNQKVIPFPLAEAQGAALAAVWANTLSLPPRAEMETWEKKQVEELGEGTAFHVLGYPRDAEYINGLHDWVMGAAGTGDEQMGAYKGKEPPYWDEKMCWVRDVYVDIKKAFVAGGGTARTLEELGFVFGKRDE